MQSIGNRPARVASGHVAGRHRALALALPAALLLAGCGGGAQDEAGAGGEQGYVRAHTIQQLMAHVVQPTADTYWQSVQFVSDETGDHDIRPETDEDWARTRAAAASLSEYGNLLMTPLYAEGRGEDWNDFARGLVEIGLQAEQAAVEQDPDKVFEVGGNLYNVCRGCHQLYPPADPPADSTSGTSGEAAEDPIRPTPGVPLEEYQEQIDE